MLDRTKQKGRISPPHRKLLKAGLNRAKRSGKDFEKGGSDPQFFIGMKDLGMYWGWLMGESGARRVVRSRCGSLQRGMAE